MKNNLVLKVVIGILIVAVAGLAVKLVMINPKEQTNVTETTNIPPTTVTLAPSTTSTTKSSFVVPIKPVACTMDAKQCPDGSYVSRILPKCEFAKCPDLKTGLLKGKITIGPLCPVEPCPITVSNPYTSRTIILQKQTGEFFPPIILQEDGSFETEIGAGIYTLSLSNCSFLGCNRSLPKTVTIEVGKTTEVEINIDTGIR